jgi:hypothetical protein
LLAPNKLGRHSADETGEHQASHGIPPTTPGKNQHRSPAPQKTKQKKVNNKQGTEN